MLLLTILNYITIRYLWLLLVINMVDIGANSIGVSILYSWLLLVILSVVIVGYSINNFSDYSI
jgi:hypothetical protein